MSQFSLSKMVSALSFAHLAGLPFKATKAGSDDQDKKNSEDDVPDDTKKESRRAQREDESDDEYADFNDEQDEKDKKSKGKAKSEENDDDETAEDDDKKNDDEDKKDDDEDEMRGKSAAASARRRERSRCAAILGSKYAVNNVVLAANLAFKTTMTRNQAVGVLRDTPAAVESNNSDRTARRNPSLGSGGEQANGSKAAVESSWDRAYSRAISPR